MQDLKNGDYGGINRALKTLAYWVGVYPVLVFGICGYRLCPDLSLSNSVVHHCTDILQAAFLSTSGYLRSLSTVRMLHSILLRE